MAGIKPPATPVQPEPEPEPKSKEERVARMEPLQFVATDEEMESAMVDREKFNAVLNKVYQAGKQEVLVNLPRILEPMVHERVDVVTKVHDFYQTNPDLFEFRAYVGAVANEVQGQHPDYGLDKLLQETESEARKRLKLTKPSGAQPSKPAFVTPPSSRKENVDTRDAIAKDIDSMLKTL